MRTAWLQIHFCVVLWGFTAILGRLISLSAVTLVWWRMVIVTGALLLFPRVWRGLRALPPHLIAIYAFIGVLVALHWLTFYGSVKLANASVAATCMALCPIFLSLVEPWIAGRRFEPSELLLGIAVIPAVALVVGGTPSGMRPGILVGVASALLVALFGSLNKRYVHHADPLTVTCVEIGAGAACITVLAMVLPHQGPAFILPDLHDASLLLVLALGCTLLPFSLSLVALRHLSAFSAQLAINLEPVYTILFAILLLGEQRELGGGFYAGVALLLGAVFLHPRLSRTPARD